MKKRVKSAGERSNKSSHITRPDEDGTLQSFIAEMKFTRRDQLTKSTSHQRLRSGSGIYLSPSSEVHKEPISPNKHSWPLLTKSQEAQTLQISRKRIQRKNLFPSTNGEEDGTESECQPGERGRGRSYTVGGTPSVKKSNKSGRSRPDSASYDTSSEKNTTTEDSEFSADEEDEDFSSGPPLNFALLESVHIDSSHGTGSNSSSSSSSSDEDMKSGNGDEGRKEEEEEGEERYGRHAGSENENESDENEDEDEDGEGGGRKMSFGSPNALPPLNLGILSSNTVPVSTRKTPASFSPRNSPRHRSMGLSPRRAESSRLMRTKSSEADLSSSEGDIQIIRERSNGRRSREEKEKEKEKEDENEFEEDLMGGLKMSPLKLKLTEAGIRHGSKGHLLGASAPSIHMKRGESMGTIPSWSRKPLFGGGNSEEGDEERGEGDEATDKEGNNKGGVARLLFSADISPRVRRNGEVGDAGSLSEKSKDFRSPALTSSASTGLPSYRGSPHTGRRKSGTVAPSKRQSYFAGDPERPSSPAGTRKSGGRNSSPNIRVPGTDLKGSASLSRREAFAISSRLQHTFSSLPTKSEFQWVYKDLPMRPNNHNTDSPSPEEEKRKNPLSSSNPSTPSQPSSPFAGSSSMVKTRSRRRSSATAMGIRRLQRSKSLNDVDSLRELMHEPAFPENGRRADGKRHSRKSSAAEGLAVSLVNKPKTVVSDEALKTKRKKLRESKRRLRDEDPFTLLLSKNKLFLRELFSPDLKFVSAICNGVFEIEDIELICTCLINLFNANGTAIQLIKWAVKSEIGATSDGALQTFLREDNRMATQFLKHYSLLKGKEYLVAVIKPVIRKMIKSKDSYEVDPRKLTPKDRPEKNLKKLKKLCQAILDAVFSPKNICPPEIQVIATYLHQEIMTKRNGESCNTPENFGISCVSTFFFLRFFCPALVSPKDHGIVKKTPTEEAKKGLLLAAKLVQVLANGQRFTQTHLLPLNEIIEYYEEAMHNFLANLASKSAVSFTDSPAASMVLPVEEIEKDQGESLLLIKEFCNRNRKKFTYSG